MTALAGKLPKGEANGLAGITADLLDDPTRVHIVVALIDCSKIVKKVDDGGDIEPTIRIRRIEAITDLDDRRRMRMILEREFERRTGRTTLPFDLQEDVQAAFDTPPGDR